MSRILSSLEKFDSKRIKVTLDLDEVTFLLYKGEVRRLGLSEGDTIEDETYRGIIDGILIPRAKKRILYFMKNADKTEGEIRRKLKEGLYPDEVINSAVEFLKRYGFADDTRYIEQYTEEKKSRYSRREIEAKLCAKGIKRDDLRELLDELLTAEDEEEAAVHAVRAKYPRGLKEDDRQGAYAYLARKGFTPDAISAALRPG